MRKFEYVGPHDAVDVLGLGVVERGTTVEVFDPSLADGLADQPDNWKHHPNKSAKAAARKPSPAQEQAADPQAPVVPTDEGDKPMSALDQQLGLVDESTYGTAPVVSRFFEFNSEGIGETESRTESDPLRVGTFVKRSDRFTPYFAGASGSISMDVLTKGFGFFLKHMLGQVVTTGPAETTVYTHTGTMADLIGKSFAAQVARPLHPSGTVQAFLYKGGKVNSWTVSNSVDGNLVLELDCDFQDVDTATALATAAYPTAMDNLTWAGGTVTVGGSAVDVTEFSVQGSNGLATDRRFIRANTLKKEPTGGRREVTFSLAADFDTMTQRNRAHATSRAGALAAIVGTWNGPTLLGTTLYPQFQLTIPAARFDEWSGANGGPEGITQSLSGMGLYDGTSSAVTCVYKSADVTA